MAPSPSHWRRCQQTLGCQAAGEAWKATKKIKAENSPVRGPCERDQTWDLQVKETCGAGLFIKGNKKEFLKILLIDLKIRQPLWQAQYLALRFELCKLRQLK